jgi:pentapeptide MXKDX repeat protein
MKNLALLCTAVCLLGAVTTLPALAQDKVDRSTTSTHGVILHHKMTHSQMMHLRLKRHRMTHSQMIHAKMTHGTMSSSAMHDTLTHSKSGSKL